MLRLLAVIFLALLCGCTQRSNAGELTGKAQEQLYIQIGSAYAPLSECMQPFLTADATRLKSLAYQYSQRDPANFRWFEAQASQYVNLDVFVRSEVNEEYASAILHALTKFAQDDASDAATQKIQRIKAMAIAMTYLSGGTQGKCAPSMQLFQWM